MKTSKKTKLRSTFLLLAVNLLVSGCATYPSAPVIDQGQLFFNKNEDWTWGTGQVFQAGENGLLIGIMIPTILHGGPRDLGIELRSIDSDGTPSDEVLAKGTLSKKTFHKKQISWHTVYFDKPYYQKKEEKLAWVTSKTPRVEPHSWHDLAFQSGNPYDKGYMYFRGWLHNGTTKPTYKDREYDMAFATLVIQDFKPLKHWWFSKENPRTVLKHLKNEIP